MKKLIFLLLLAVVLGGFVAAQNIAYPPGALTLDAVLSGDDVHEAVITPDTVSSDMLFEQPAGFLSCSDFYMIDVPAGQPLHYHLIKPMVVGQGIFIPPKVVEFHLRL